jgi:hypothetical protein
VLSQSTLLKESERYLNDVTIELSDMIFLVVNQLTRPDQEFIHRIAEQLFPSNEKKEFVVVHNLRDIDDEQTFIQLSKDVTRFYQGDMRHGQGVPYFQSRLFEKIYIKHVFLTNQKQRWGANWNDKVLKLMHEWVRGLDRAPNRMDPKEKLCQVLAICLQRHYREIQDIRLQNDRFVGEFKPGSKPVPNYETVSDVNIVQNTYPPAVIFYSHLRSHS